MNMLNTRKPGAANGGLVKRLLAPVAGEWPFFVLFSLAISVMPIRFLPSHIHYMYWDRVLGFLLLDFPRAMAISYVLTSLVYCSRSKALKTILYAFASLLYATCLFLHLVFHKTLQPDIIVLLAETNAKETSEFVSSFLFSARGVAAVFLLSLYLAAVAVCERSKGRVVQWLRTARCRMCCSVILLALVLDGMVQFRIYHDIVSSESVDFMPDEYGCYDSVTTLFYSLYSMRLVEREMKQAVAATVKIRQQRVVNGETDSLNVVYVIGESYIKHHAQLYGYILPTTPHLCRERDRGNLFVFDNVVSAFNNTSLTMKNTLCTNSLRLHEKWCEHPYFPAIFKKAGYNVYFWDVQKDDSVQAVFEFSLNTFVYDKALAKEAYTQTSSRHFQYDDDAVRDFSKEVNSLGRCNLVMFHLMGQHVKFGSRYPHDRQFVRFSHKDIASDKPYLDDDKRQTIAEYDNAVLYNDYVLKHIIDLFRDKNTVILYFSDHGEEVYDYRDSFGRASFDSDKVREGLKCQYEVPFMIWCSDEYMRRNPDVVGQIKAAMHRPFRTDDICQVVFHLARLRTAYYKKQCDLLSTSYQTYDRVVGEEQFDYDKIVGHR